jgi:hypothetical protein
VTESLGFVAVGLCWLLAPLSFAMLLSQRRYGAVVAFALAIVLGPLLFLGVSSIRDDHVRMWVGFVAAPLVPVYILLGVLLFMASLDSGRAKTSQHAGKKRLGVRLLGAATLAIGLAAWFFGASHRELSGVETAALLAMVFYGLIGGGLWLATGQLVPTDR